MLMRWRYRVRDQSCCNASQMSLALANAVSGEVRSLSLGFAELRDDSPKPNFPSAPNMHCSAL